MAALLDVGNLVFDLYAAGTGFDDFLRQQVSGFLVTKTRVDVGNNRYHVSFEIIYLVLNSLFLNTIAGFTGGIKFAEQSAQFTCISLAQVGVNFFNQFWHRGFFMH